MKLFALITLVGTAIAVVIGPHGPLGGFWAPTPEAPHVHGPLMAGFLAENMVENIAFGAGLAIALLGRHRFATTTAWLASIWLLASWMPHAALHQHFGMRPEALLPIEWIFHAGAILAVAALLISIHTHTRHRSTERHTDPVTGPA